MPLTIICIKANICLHLKINLSSAKCWLLQNVWYMHYVKYIINHSSCIIHHASFIIHHASCIIHHEWFIMHHSSCIIYNASFFMYHSSCIIPHVKLIMHHSSSLMHHRKALSMLHYAHQTNKWLYLILSKPSFEYWYLH